MSENGDKTSRKLFENGGLPGPGRGNKKEVPDELEGLDFWEATELMIRKDVTSTDPAIRKGAVATYLKWKTMKDVFDEKNKGRGDGIYTPEVLELLKMRDLIPKLGGTEGVEKMLNDCPGCAKFPGRVFKFNLPENKRD